MAWHARKKYQNLQKLTVEEVKLDRTGSNWIKLDQTGSNWVKLITGSNWIKVYKWVNF